MATTSHSIVRNSFGLSTLSMSGRFQELYQTDHSLCST